MKEWDAQQFTFEKTARERTQEQLRSAARTLLTRWFDDTNTDYQEHKETQDAEAKKYGARRIGTIVPELAKLKKFDEWPYDGDLTEGDPVYVPATDDMPESQVIGLPSPERFIEILSYFSENGMLPADVEDEREEDAIDDEVYVVDENLDTYREQAQAAVASLSDINSFDAYRNWLTEHKAYLSSAVLNVQMVGMGEVTMPLRYWLNTRALQIMKQESEQLETLDEVLAYRELASKGFYPLKALPMVPGTSDAFLKKASERYVDPSRQQANRIIGKALMRVVLQEVSALDADAFKAYKERIDALVAAEKEAPRRQKLFEPIYFARIGKVLKDTARKLGIDT